MDKLLQDFYKWYAVRTRSEHLWILLFAVILMTLVWYYLLFHPLIVRKDRLVQQAQDIKKQISIYQQQIQSITLQGQTRLAANKQEQTKLKLLQQKSMSGIAALPTNLNEENNLLVSTIFPANSPVKFASLKKQDVTPAAGTKTPAGQNLQILFQGDYFGTIAYLKSLEKLPWCLSWDTLEYKVLNHPNAEVTLELHFVNT